jgi:hypothetical protein
MVCEQLLVVGGRKLLGICKWFVSTSLLLSPLLARVMDLFVELEKLCSFCADNPRLNSLMTKTISKKETPHVRISHMKRM